VSRLLALSERLLDEGEGWMKRVGERGGGRGLYEEMDMAGGVWGGIGHFLLQAFFE